VGYKAELLVAFGHSELVETINYKEDVKAALSLLSSSDGRRSFTPGKKCYDKILWEAS